MVNAASPKKISNLFETLYEWVIYGLVAIIPFAYLSGTSQPLEFPKQLLLLIGVGIIAVLWGLHALLTRKISFKVTPANFIVLALAVLTLVSALISNTQYVSLWGAYGREYASFASLLLFACFFFLATNTNEQKLSVERLLLVFFGSGVIISLAVLMGHAGVPLFSYLSARSLTVIGGNSFLGTWMAVQVVLSSAYLLWEHKRMSFIKRILALITVVLGVVICVAVDFWVVWAILIVPLCALLLLAVLRPQSLRRPAFLAVPMAVLLVAVLFLFVNLPSQFRFGLTNDGLSWGGTATVIGKEWVRHPFLGTGPGTFPGVFSQYRDASFNNSADWAIRFEHGASFFTTIAATMGVLGTLAYLGVAAFFLWKGFAFAFGKKTAERWIEGVTLAVGFAGSVLSLLLYGGSMAHLFLFWFLAALLARTASKGSREYDLRSSPRASLALTLSFAVTVIVVVAAWFNFGTKLYADALFVKAITVHAGTPAGVVADLEKAVGVHPSSDLLFRNLSQAYLNNLQAVASDQAADQQAQFVKAKNLARGAVAAAKQAAILAPGETGNWTQLGAANEHVLFFFPESEAAAVEAYQKAIALEPMTPGLHVDLARMYATSGAHAKSITADAKDEAVKKTNQKNADDNFALAKSEFERALELKPEYVPASYQYAIMLNVQGKHAEAIALMEGVRKHEIETGAAPDPTVAFELGHLYFVDLQLPKAEAAFLVAIEIANAQQIEYSDARWFLAQVYEKQKRWDDAIKQVELVQKAGNDTDQVRSRIEDLKAKKAAQK